MPHKLEHVVSRPALLELVQYKNRAAQRARRRAWTSMMLRWQAVVLCGQNAECRDATGPGPFAKRGMLESYIVQKVEAYDRLELDGTNSG